jgi:proteasome assembly chaperone (PAC2) family protein
MDLNDTEFVGIYINKMLQRIIDLEVKNLELETKVERSGQLLKEAREIMYDCKKKEGDPEKRPQGYFDDN